ncbi:MAG: bacteriohemerythrin [Peptococcales bacterium]
MIRWKDEYKIGIQLIDEQHKKLFEICDRTYALLQNEIFLDKYDKIIQVLNELRDYTIYHFETEEEYMRKIGYKKLLSHKVYHTDFIDKIKSLDFEKIDEQQDATIIEILDFVLKWIENHILTEDKKIVL